MTLSLPSIKSPNLQLRAKYTWKRTPAGTLLDIGSIPIGMAIRRGHYDQI